VHTLTIDCRGWNITEWTASDDRVRGGKSQSYLSLQDSYKPPRALLHGHLDITALGGAGFASQRTVQTDKIWNLSQSDGIIISVAPGSQSRTPDSQKTHQSPLQITKKCHKFTFILKDTLLPPDPSNGREQSTISWEGDFEVEDDESPKEVVFAWNDLKPFYRGKEVRDVKKPLKLDGIKRFSIMVRRQVAPQPISSI
jgi:Complex I intermediate-associated protein 30 (CIA30)